MSYCISIGLRRQLVIERLHRLATITILQTFVIKTCTRPWGFTVSVDALGVANREAEKTLIIIPVLMQLVIILTRAYSFQAGSVPASLIAI